MCLSQNCIQQCRTAMFLLCSSHDVINTATDSSPHFLGLTTWLGQSWWQYEDLQTESRLSLNFHDACKTTVAEHSHTHDSLSRTYSLHLWVWHQIFYRAVCGTEASQANRHSASQVGWALGDSRPIVVLPTSHARFLWWVVHLSKEVERHCFLCQHCPPEMKRQLRDTRLILTPELWTSLTVPD